MRWKVGRRSDNVVDMRGSGGGGRGRMPFGGGGGLGLGGIAVVVVIGLILGKNPLEMLGMVAQMQGDGGGVPQQQEGQAPPAGDETAEFVSVILGETEDAWGPIFQASGQTYAAPKLNLFSGGVNTACGSASSASGPFYCPGDHEVYIDLSFFEEMKARLGGGGDFAYAYVIAHEVGHHVQTLLGVSAKVNAARQRGQEVQGDGGLLVRQELQADCYAGVWANVAQAKHQWLEAGDVEEAMNTATAIGDDRLQKQSQGHVVPDAFSHGTSEQRVRWFKAGFESGDPNRCDTFSASRL
ncbi:MAG: neutral zinc metallopeptidase [Panacagrimonas sp.]|jgi:predicted metalloprotease|nr:neutral zinc metallopeptidase [Panacagrimonas sp.]MCC2658153.1 neutral zinc metallopeptidase [Panacagrimonas sp.]